MKYIPRVFVLGILFLVCSASGFSQGYEIQENYVIFKGLRIQLLTPTMIRIQKEKNHSYTDSTDLGVINLKFQKTPFNVSINQGIYTIITDSLLITYDPSAELTKGGIKIRFHEFRLNSLAEKDSLNLGGVIGALDNCKGNIHYKEQNDVTSPHDLRLIPDGILSQRGFTVLRHTRDTLDFFRAGKNDDELYVLGYGHDYKQAFHDFYALAGKIPMLPEWSLGFIYSRWKDYSAGDYKKIVSRFRQEKIPIDAIILDMCWHIDYWYGFRYDTVHFPDMKAFHQWTDSVHLKTGFNHHAGAIYYKDPKVREFCSALNMNYDSAVTSGPPWEPQHKIIRYDPTNQKQFRTFYKLYLSPLMKDGLDFHWVDGVSSIYSSDLYQKFTRDYTGKRPVVMNRLQENVLCNHRYPFGFSGDTYISWETMAYTLEANIKGGNNGVYWSHDIGGYMPQGPGGYPPGAEMFARWLQLGAVSPIFRVHAKKDVYWTPPVKPGAFDQGSRLPWEWGDTVLRSARTSIQLRYKLLPYIYTNTRIAHEQGIPLCRGLYIDYPASASAYRYDEFMFGNEILAAPILTASNHPKERVTQRTLWLPKGLWYDYFTRQIYEGDKEITVAKSLFEFPLFVKAGSILPIAPYREYSEAPLDTLIILAYSPVESGNTEFRLYEDDGESFAFRQNQYRWINIKYNYKKDRSHKIVIDKPEGSFKGEEKKRAYKIYVINSAKPKHLTMNGKALENNWKWDPESKTTEVMIGTRDMDEPIIIKEEL
ncbi:MAG TPA: TIM-barrel domain-containing protein [Bacteroidales bacterium]